MYQLWSTVANSSQNSSELSESMAAAQIFFIAGLLLQAVSANLGRLLFGQLTNRMYIYEYNWPAGKIPSRWKYTGNKNTHQLSEKYFVT